MLPLSLKMQQLLTLFEGKIWRVSEDRWGSYMKQHSWYGPHIETKSYGTFLNEKEKFRQMRRSKQPFHVLTLKKILSHDFPLANIQRKPGHKELCIKSTDGERAPDIKHTKACSRVRTQEFEKRLKHIVEE